MTEFIVLGCLSIKNMTGYEIKKLMSYSTNFFSQISYGSIYPILKKFEEQGLVVSFEDIDNGRFKKVYQITDEGLRVLVDWLNEPLKSFTFKYETLLRVFFAHNIPEDALIHIIQDHLEQIHSIAKALDDVALGPGKTADKYQLYTMRFGQDFYKFLIKWWSNLLREIKNNAGYEDSEGGINQKYI